MPESSRSFGLHSPDSHEEMCRRRGAREYPPVLAAHGVARAVCCVCVRECVCVSIFFFFFLSLSLSLSLSSLLVKVVTRGA